MNYNTVPCSRRPQQVERMVRRARQGARFMKAIQCVGLVGPVMGVSLWGLAMMGCGGNEAQADGAVGDTEKLGTAHQAADLVGNQGFAWVFNGNPGSSYSFTDIHGEVP